MPEGSPRDWTPDDLRRLAAEDRSVRIGEASDREAAETDFGRLVRGATAAVIAPRSTDDLERIVAFANAHGLGLTPRGRGLSQGGQAVAAGGVTLDLSRLDRVDAPDARARTVRCGGGATFRSLVEAAAPHALAPAVAPLNLDLTVGGVLSVGGIGATSHAHGPVIDQVVELEVVTGGGRRVQCSAEREPAVFEAVLGGLGRAGIITSATLRLRPVKPKVRTFSCLYDSVDRWLADQRALVASGRADHLEAFCSPSVQGFRNGPRGRRPFAEWFYVLHTSVEYEGAPPEAAEALEGLHPYRVVHQEDNASLAFADRYAPRFAMMRRSGAWQQVHPWIETLVPASTLKETIARVLDQVPLALGENPRLLFVARSSPRRFFMVPPEGELAILALTPAAVPPYLQDEALAAMRSIHDTLSAAGGRRYLSGWLGMMDAASWRNHYGKEFDSWLTLKRDLDPNGVLGSALFPGDRQ